jgi:ribosomal protein S18 acetylase RimI-like enzyme
LRGKKFPARDLAMIQRAIVKDLDDLVALMGQYYAYDGLKFDPQKARTAMAGLVSSQDHGAVWVVRDGSRAVGYLALCLGYSLEYGGRDAFIDEVFVSEAFRNQGWGAKLIETALAAAEEAGVRAVHLGVQRTNPNAMRLYRRLGFEPHAATLMTRRL